MKYDIIQPPFTLDFQEMSREEAEDYFNWFMKQIPNRVKMLEQAVQSTIGYQNWQADDTPGSLEQLGQWFCEHIETRGRKEREKENIYNEAPKWFKSVQVEDWELTNRTFSLALDIGMYLGRVLKKSFPALKWTMIKRPKSYVNYQQPVLVGTSKFDFNPIRVVVIYAYSLADNTQTGERLRSLYNIWADRLFL